jgi:hypothetical protein
MKSATTIKAATISAVLLLAIPAQAQVQIAFQQAQSDASMPSVAQILNVNTTSDWTAASIVIKLDNGSIVQDRYIAQDPPSTSPGVHDSGSIGGTADDSREFSGAADLNLPPIASATGPQAFGNTVLVAGGGEQDLGGKSLWMDSRRMDLCWYSHSRDDIGWGSIGRFTLSDDAIGTWTLAVTQAQDDKRYTFAGKIINGQLLIDP